MGDTDVSQRASTTGPSPSWVTDGGLETDLIFHSGVDLPEFAAYPLLDNIRGRSLLADYFSGYAAVAAAAGASLLLETPTWRANPQWVARLGGDDDVVRRITIDSAAFLAVLAPTLGSNGDTLVLGMIGPRGDGYVAGESTSADEFASYHETQVAAFAQSAAAGVTGYTMTTVAEAVGIVLAAREYRLDVGVSFTVETDGRLPDGTPLADAVTSLWAQAAPDRLLLNCAHPSHFAAASPTTPRGPLGSPACAPTPHDSHTPSSTRPTPSTRATSSTSSPSTSGWPHTFRTSRSSAGAAAPTPATSPRSGEWDAARMEG